MCWYICIRLPNFSPVLYAKRAETPTSTLLDSISTPPQNVKLNGKRKKDRKGQIDSRKVNQTLSLFSDGVGVSRGTRLFRHGAKNMSPVMAR